MSALGQKRTHLTEERIQEVVNAIDWEEVMNTVIGNTNSALAGVGKSLVNKVVRHIYWLEKTIPGHSFKSRFHWPWKIDLLIFGLVSLFPKQVPIFGNFSTRGLHKNSLAQYR